MRYVLIGWKILERNTNDFLHPSQPLIRTTVTCWKAKIRPCLHFLTLLQGFQWKLLTKSETDINPLILFCTEKYYWERFIASWIVHKVVLLYGSWNHLNLGIFWQPAGIFIEKKKMPQLRFEPESLDAMTRILMYLILRFQSCSKIAPNTFFKLNIKS